jgi:hypothetical protein
MHDGAVCTKHSGFDATHFGAHDDSTAPLFRGAESIATANSARQRLWMPILAAHGRLH